jgi:hypothetical protein
MGENGPGRLGHQHSTTSSETDNTPATLIDQAQENRRSPSVLGPDIYVIEDFSTDSQRSDPSIQIVKPYAIEEPDDGATSEPEGSSLPQQGQPKPWEDLVTSMEELYCDSDNSSSGLLFSKRGRKRKPPITPTVPQSGQPRQSTLVPDVQYERPSLSLKRPRRRDQRRISGDNLGAAQGYRFYNAGGLGGSSSTSVSTDTSGANSIKGSPAPDAMDID